MNANKEVIKLHKKFGFQEIVKKNNIDIPNDFNKKTTHLYLSKENWLKIKKNLEKKFLLL